MLKLASKSWMILSLVIFGVPGSFPIMTFTALHHLVSVSPCFTTVARNCVRVCRSRLSCVIALKCPRCLRDGDMEVISFHFWTVIYITVRDADQDRVLALNPIRYGKGHEDNAKYCVVAVPRLRTQPRQEFGLPGNTAECEFLVHLSAPTKWGCRGCPECLLVISKQVWLDQCLVHCCQEKLDVERRRSCLLVDVQGQESEWGLQSAPALLLALCYGTY